jgi:hypothetical protein
LIYLFVKDNRNKSFITQLAGRKLIRSNSPIFRKVSINYVNNPVIIKRHFDVFIVHFASLDLHHLLDLTYYTKVAIENCNVIDNVYVNKFLECFSRPDFTSYNYNFDLIRAKIESLESIGNTSNIPSNQDDPAVREITSLQDQIQARLDLNRGTVNRIYNRPNAHNEQ